MDKLRRISSFVAPAVVIGAVGFFVYYSLYIYQPSGHVACGQSMLAQQTDVAVHVVRQWFGKEGQQYTGCPEAGQ